MKPHRNYATPSGDMWHPREAQKRSISIHVRVTTDELDALKWMAGQLASDFGHQENPDVIRRALDLLHTKLRTKSAAAAPIPPATAPAPAPAAKPAERTAFDVRQKLAETIEAGAFNQATIGKQTGIDAAMLSRFRKGTGNLGAEKLATLARWLWKISEN